MRFLSCSQAFKKTVKKAERQLVNTPNGPELRELTQPIIAYFQQGGATAKDKQLALEKFRFKGLSEREDPTRRISVYDTDEQASKYGWSDDIKAEIEANLLAGQNQYYFVVEQEPTAKPWPSYDTTDPDLIRETAELVGVDFGQVLAYERENANRAEVFAQFEAPEPAGDEVEVEA